MWFLAQRRSFVGALTVQILTLWRRMDPKLPRRLDPKELLFLQIAGCGLRTHNDKNSHMPLAATVKRPLLGFKLAFVWLSFYLIRLCERVLPPSALSLLLWPSAAAIDLLQVRERKLLTCWRRFPASWRPKVWRFLSRQGLGLYHSQLLYLWPDRLGAKRWLSRCRLEGEGNLIGAREGNRGAVLASLHFGPYELLPYWLRAHGIVTTSVRVRPPDSLKTLTDYVCSLSPPADVPVFLYAEDLVPLPRFSHVRSILGPRRRLLVMVDVAQRV